MAQHASHRTFLHFGPLCSQQCICYYHQDLHQKPFQPGSRLSLCDDFRALLLMEASHLLPWPSIGHTLKRHPFSGLIDSAGELLHTP
jgi:hypothetical protein